MNETDESEPKKQPPSREGNELYQAPPHHTSISPRPRPKTTTNRKPGPHIHPLEKLTQNYVKTVLIVLGFMAILVFVAIKLSSRVFQMRHIHQVNEGRSPSSAGTPAPTPDPTPSPSENKEGTILNPASVGELDTQVMRKAIYLARRAQSMENNYQYEDALEKYQEALDIWPSLNQVWASLGRVYLKKLDLSRAKLAISRALENEPHSASLINALGVVYLYMDNVEKAEELFETSRDIDSDLSDPLFNLALCRMAINQRDEAREWFEAYLRRNTNDAAALKEMAYLDASINDYESALAHLKKALGEAPEWPVLYFDAAAASALLGLLDEAIDYLEKGEALTSPALAFRIYSQPAFNQIRETEAGKLFEEEMVTRARALLEAGESMDSQLPQAEPKWSIESSI